MLLETFMDTLDEIDPLSQFYWDEDEEPNNDIWQCRGFEKAPLRYYVHRSFHSKRHYPC